MAADTEKTRSLKPETLRILTILFWTICSCVFIFFSTFYSSFNFIASSVKLLLLSLLILPASLYVSYRIYITDSETKKDSRRGRNFFFIFNVAMIHLMISGILSFLNIKLDDSDFKTISVPVGLVEVTTQKHSRSYRAWVDLPFETSCCFIPESYQTIPISKSEYEGFAVGKSIVYIQYRDGFFGLPWLEKSVMMQKE